MHIHPTVIRKERGHGSIFEGIMANALHAHALLADEGGEGGEGGEEGGQRGGGGGGRGDGRAGGEGNGSGSRPIELVLVLSARTILSRPLVVPRWIEAPIAPNRTSDAAAFAVAAAADATEADDAAAFAAAAAAGRVTKPRVHVSDWKVGHQPWLWNWTEATALHAAAPTAVAGLHEGLVFRGEVLPRLAAFAASPVGARVLSQLYAAPFAAEEFAPWTILDLLGGSYASTLAPRGYPGLDVDQLVPTCAVAIRVLGYAYEWLFRRQALDIRERLRALDARRSA